MNLTKDHSIQIKGAAILCMMLFHLFGFPERISTSAWWMGMPIIKALQICVPIYLLWLDMVCNVWLKGGDNMEDHWKTIEEIIFVFLVGSSAIYYYWLYYWILCI